MAQYENLCINLQTVTNKRGEWHLGRKLPHICGLENLPGCLIQLWFKLSTHFSQLLKLDIHKANTNFRSIHLDKFFLTQLSIHALSLDLSTLHFSIWSNRSTLTEVENRIFLLVQSDFLLLRLLNRFSLLSSMLWENMLDQVVSRLLSTRRPTSEVLALFRAIYVTLSISVQILCGRW